MTYRKRLTLSFFIILAIQTLLGVSLTYFNISGLLRDQSRTILEEGWTQQESKFNELFKQINKDLYFYKYLIRNMLDEENPKSDIDDLLEKCLANTIAHTVGLYSESGDLLISKQDGGLLNDFTIQNSPYSLLDFRFPTSKISWSQTKNNQNYFGLVSGSRILSNENIYYLIFFTDFKQHLQQISERKPEVLTVISLKDRMLYSDFPGVDVIPRESVIWSERKIGNETFLVYGKPIWSKNQDLVTLSVLHSITAEKEMMNKIIRSALIVFTFSWFLAFAVSLWVSRIFSYPLVSLNNSLETYLERGEFPLIEVSKMNDFAFLVSSIQNLTNKIIMEEQQVRSQVEEIQRLNKYNEDLLESIQSGILVVDKYGKIEFCNSFLLDAAVLSYDKIIGESFSDILRDLMGLNIKDLDDLLRKTIITGIQLRIKDSNSYKYSLKVSPVYVKGQLEKVLLMLEDTTEVDRIWEESLLMDRVSSLSILSAGMGHEINNPLAAIQSHIDYLDAIEDDPEKIDSLKWIKDGVGRISSIVSDTAQYTRSTNFDFTENLPVVVENTVHLIIHSKTKKEIEIDVDSKGEIPKVRIPEDLCKQLILNLLMNSIDAGGDNPVIKIKIFTDVTLKKVYLHILDEGIGIPEDVLPGVFNPFYSHGKGNKGSGLGLSVCYGIVTRSGGRISIENRVDKGVIVKVELDYFENTDS